MPYVLLTCQLLLAGVFLAAFTGKLLNSYQFGDVLRLSPLPPTLVRPLMVLVPAIELCLASGLLLSPPWLLPSAMIATAGLLAIFTVWMVSMHARGLHAECGCFGAGSSDIGINTIARNVFLLVVSLGGIAFALSSRSALPSASTWSIVSVLTLELCAVLLLTGWRTARHFTLTMGKLEHLVASADSK